jgi:hypothetical protein
MARTTSTPHKVSHNKSGTPIVRASKLFPGRPKRTTRELAFETEQQARLFADALNLAAIRDGDWRWWQALRNASSLKVGIWLELQAASRFSCSTPAAYAAGVI